MYSVGPFSYLIIENEMMINLYKLDTIKKG